MLYAHRMLHYCGGDVNQTFTTVEFQSVIVQTELDGLILAYCRTFSLNFYANMDEKCTENEKLESFF